MACPCAIYLLGGCAVLSHRWHSGSRHYFPAPRVPHGGQERHVVSYVETNPRRESVDVCKPTKKQDAITARPSVLPERHFACSQPTALWDKKYDSQTT